MTITDKSDYINTCRSRISIGGDRDGESDCSGLCGS